MNETFINKLRRLASIPGKFEPIKPINGFYTIVLSPPIAARLSKKRSKFRERNWQKAHWMLQGRQT